MPENNARSDRLPGILYLTWKSSGSSGANAAELYPRLAANSGQFKSVAVAGCGDEVPAGVTQIGLDDSILSDISNSQRLTHFLKDNHIGLVHVIYRKRMLPTLFLLRLMKPKDRPYRIVLDFRSVNLSVGLAREFFRTANQLALPYVDLVAGNFRTAETNLLHPPERIATFDLGYDGDAVPGAARSTREGPPRVWFIGSIAPKNRNSEFLLDVFDQLEAEAFGLKIHVAGDARPDQIERLRGNSVVRFHGRIHRQALYEMIGASTGIGLAFMDQSSHGQAPALKLCEYAALGLRIVASDTPGLRTQADRMNLPDPLFVPQKVAAWVAAIKDMAKADALAAPTVWQDADQWSYEVRFHTQVLPTYRAIASTL